MKATRFDEAWNELKSRDKDSEIQFGTAEEVSRIIVELIEKRVELGYSQRDLAAICGIKQSAIARMESIKTIPRLDTVIRVAGAMGITIVLSSPSSKRQARVDNLRRAAEAREV